MRGANMSVVGRTVVKLLATRTTSVRVFGDAFFVCLEVTIKIRLRLKPFLAAGTFVRFLPRMDSLVSFEVIQTSEGLATSLTAMFLARPFGRGFPRTRLNILQLIIIS